MNDEKRDERYVRIKYENAMRTIKNARARSHNSSKTEASVSNNIILGSRRSSRDGMWLFDVWIDCRDDSGCRWCFNLCLMDDVARRVDYGLALSKMV